MIKVTAASLLLSTGLTVAAQAVDVTSIADMEETATLPDGSGINVWLGGGYFNAPVANGLGTVGDAGSFLFLQQTDNGAALSNLGASAGVTVWVPTDHFTLFGAIDGDFVRATNTDSVLVDPTGVLVDTLPIDGDTSPGQIFSAAVGTYVDSTASIEYDRVNAVVGLGMTIGENLHLTPGLFGSAGRLSLMSTVSNPADATDFVSLDETVNMYSAGPMINAHMEHPVGDNVAIELSGRGALLFAHGELNASQTASNLAGTIEVSSTSSGMAGLVEAQAGLDFDVSDGVELGIFGGLGVRNDYFSIVNPRSAPGLDANDPASYNPGPASLVQSLLWNATAGMSLTGNF